MIDDRVKVRCRRRLLQREVLGRTAFPERRASPQNERSENQRQHYHARTLHNLECTRRFVLETWGCCFAASTNNICFR